jgi:hypothetical protein
MRRPDLSFFLALLVLPLRDTEFFDDFHPIHAGVVVLAHSSTSSR